MRHEGLEGNPESAGRNSSGADDDVMSQYPLATDQRTPVLPT